MKKLILIIIALVAAVNLKAQQLPGSQGNPAVKIPELNRNTDTIKQFKPLKPLPLLTPKMDFNNEVLASIDRVKGATDFYGTMPVAVNKTGKYRMPVVKTDKPGEKYMMLIKRYNLVDPNLPQQPKVTVPKP